MEWKLINLNEYNSYKKISNTLLGDFNKNENTSKSIIFSFSFVQNDEIIIFSPPPPHAQNPANVNFAKFPLLIFTIEDLSQSDNWKIIISILKPCKTEVAIFWHQNLKNLNIDESVFFESLNLKDHFQTRSDFRELSLLSKNCLTFAALYDAPLKILRLWNRFDEISKNFLYSLFEEFDINKNLVFEIISIYYDFDIKKKELYQESIKKFRENIKIKTNKLDNFSQNTDYTRDIRDLAFSLRYPNIQKTKIDLYKQKSKIESFLDNNAEVVIPKNFEVEDLQINLKIKSEMDSLNVAKKLQDDKFKILLKDFLNT